MDTAEEDQVLGFIEALSGVFNVVPGSLVFSRNNVAFLPNDRLIIKRGSNNDQLMLAYCAPVA